MLDGIELATADDNARTDLRGSMMGFVFQAPNLLPVFSALENVALPLVLDGTPPADARRCRRRARASGRRTPPRADAGPDVGRGTATGRARAGIRQEAPHRVGGRTDRQPRLEISRGRHGPVAGVARRRHDVDPGYARSRARRAKPSVRSGCVTVASSASNSTEPCTPRGPDRRRVAVALAAAGSASLDPSYVPSPCAMSAVGPDAPCSSPTGVLLATATLASASVVGDSLRSSIRRSASTQLGPVDEMVVAGVVPTPPVDRRHDRTSTP